MDSNLISAPPDNAPKIQWRIPEVDGVRAFAMLMVVIFHSIESANLFSVSSPWGSINLTPFISLLPAGVDMFMVLSGFCLFFPFCRKSREEIRFDTKDYALRRVRRILPPYYAAILFAITFPQLLVVLFRLLGKTANWQPLPSALQWVTHLTFTHLFFVETWDGIAGAFWSLSLEAQFYVVFPLIIFSYIRFGTKTFWWMICISIIYRIGVGIGLYYAGHTSPNFEVYRFLWETNLLGRWMQFGSGMLAAHFVAEQWKNERKFDARIGNLLVLVAVTCFLSHITIPSVNLFVPFRDLMLSISYSTLMVAVCTSKNFARGFFASRIMSGLGYISYSIFLIHQPIIYYCGQFFQKVLPLQGLTQFLFMFVMGFGITLLITKPFFALFEKPFLKKPAAKNVEIPAVISPV